MLRRRHVKGERWIGSDIRKVVLRIRVTAVCGGGGGGVLVGIVLPHEVVRVAYVDERSRGLVVVGAQRLRLLHGLIFGRRVVVVVDVLCEVDDFFHFTHPVGLEELNGRVFAAALASALLGFALWLSASLARKEVGSSETERMIVSIFARKWPENSQIAPGLEATYCAAAL